MNREAARETTARPSFQQLEARLLLDGTAFGPQRDLSLSLASATCVYAADLDGDGDADILSASRLDGKIAWYENLGGGDFSAQKIISTEANGAQSVYATDLDGDGDADVLSASYADSKIAWYENLTLPVPGDSDNDGDVDLDDLLAVSANFGTMSGASRAQGDVAPHPTGDGAVNLDDLFMIRNNFGYGMSAAPDEPVAVLSTSSPVPIGDGGELAVTSQVPASARAVQARGEKWPAAQGRSSGAPMAEANVLAGYAYAGSPRGFDPLAVDEPSPASRSLADAGSPIAPAVTNLPHESMLEPSTNEASAVVLSGRRAGHLAWAAPQLGAELPDVLALPSLEVDLAAAR